MEAQYLNTILILLAFTFLTMFFIFTTAMAVYLKIFIQKRSSAKEFILSKNYTGGMPNKQFKWMHYFDIFYDFLMLFILSLLTFAIPALIALGQDGKSYQVIVLYLFLISFLVVIVPINEIESITKPRWIFTLFAPKGIMIIWRKGSKFGYVYNFISKNFIYIFLLVVFGVVVIVFLTKNKISITSKSDSFLNSSLDQSLVDILPIQPESSGDIPQFVGLLRNVLISKDIGICNSLPIPQSQKFFFGDYSMNAPTSNQWKMYCMALVNENPALCQSIDSSSHPNLQQECQHVIEKILSPKDNSYTFCYEQFGSLYISSDEVRNCYLKYKLDNAPEFYRNLFACLQQSDEPVNQTGSKRGECLYSLAKVSQQSKVCNLIEIPYPAYKYSVSNCIFELSK